MSKKILNINETPGRIVLEKLKNFKPDPWPQRAVDFLMILFHAYGMDPFDALTLKWKYWKDYAIDYTPRRFMQSKRRHDAIRVNVTEKLHELIMKYANKDQTEDAYIFPFITPNLKHEELLAEVKIFVKTANKHLKKISEKEGIEKISLSNARRIFAEEAREVVNDIIADRDISYNVCRCNHHDHTKTIEAFYLNRASSSASEN